MKNREMNRKPITHPDWLASLQPSEYRIKAFLEDKMFKSEKAIEAVSGIMARSMTRAVFVGGQKVPLGLEQEREREPALRGWSYVFLVDGEPEGIPEQYLMMTYDAWCWEYQERVRLESLSLWGHIRYWYRRRCKAARQKRTKTEQRVLI